LTKAIELEPTLQDLYLQRARIREAQGDPDGVINDMNELIRLAPTMFTAYEIRARNLRAKGDIAREAQDLARAGELAGGPRGYYDYSVSAQLYLEVGNFSRAVETATAALAIQPNSVDALILRGLANDKLGSAAAANADYDKALEVDPKAPSVMLARADLLRQSGQAQQSTRILQRIIEFADKRLQRDSTDGGAFYVRYEANQLLGNRIAADQDLRSAQKYYKPD
jgi:tetratricopeptide (TPR) repeat protein